MIPHGRVKLGKQPKRTDPRTFKLARYLIPGGLPTPPDEISYVVDVPSWPMLLNDQLGDCVIAAMGHMVQQWSFFASQGKSMRVMTDYEALAAYELIGGYNPADPSTDRGVVMLDALNFWRNQGIMVDGTADKIAGFVEVDASNPLEVKQAIWLFGNLFTGLALPVAVQGADDWTIPLGGIYGQPGQPGSWGGHCVPCDAESPITLTCVTWAERLKMSHNFFGDYCDEAYAVLSSDWIGMAGQTIGHHPPGVFNLAQFKADLAKL